MVTLADHGAASKTDPKPASPVPVVIRIFHGGENQESVIELAVLAA